MRDGISNLLPRPVLAVLLMAVVAAARPSAVQADANFSKVMASASKRELTEWGRRYQHGEGVARDLDNAIRL